MRSCEDCGAALSDTAAMERSVCLRCWNARKRSGTLPVPGKPRKATPTPAPPEKPWRVWLAVLLAIILVKLLLRLAWRHIAG